MTKESTLASIETEKTRPPGNLEESMTELPRSLYRIKGTDIVFDPPLQLKNGESVEYTATYDENGKIISVEGIKLIKVENVEPATDEQ